mgnify:CR=1 FL=1|jgi:glycerol kinase
MEKYIIALDQGTTSCRSILFNNKGQLIASEQKEFMQIFPESGWVEHNPKEIWETQYKTLLDLIKNNNLNAKQIDSIGITNQRETTLIWNKNTGEPIYNAIVWQDNRTSVYCQDLKSKGHETLFRQKTGLVLDSYFSGTKINWILNNVTGAKEMANNGLLLFGTIDTWLIWNLTNKKIHATDISNASRTLICNIHELIWDSELLEILEIPAKILPEIKDCSADFGCWDFNGIDIPICGVAGDQQAALFGQCCFEDGSAKNTYGTGCFMLMNTGPNAIESTNGLLTTVAWSLDGKVTYALEGSVFIAGAAIQWLRDGLKIISSASETQDNAMNSKADDLVFVPAFAGLGAPYWDMNVKGGIFGLTRDIGINDLCKATLESLAFQTRDVIVAMEKDAELNLNTLAVDGGACINDFLMQFQSDILNAQVKRPKTIESTALGAAYLAGIKTGYYDVKSLKNNHKIERTFQPEKDLKAIKNKIINWDKAIQCLIKLHNNNE